MGERVTTESVALGAAGKVTGDMAGFSRDLAADLLDARATIVALTAERDAERARVTELEAAASSVMTTWAMIDEPDHCPSCGTEDTHEPGPDGPCPVGELQQLLGWRTATSRAEHVPPAPVTDTGDCRTCKWARGLECLRLGIETFDADVDGWQGSSLSSDSMTRKPNAPRCPGWTKK